MLLALIADTHMPRGNRRLPDACIHHLEQADLIIHAGDFVTKDMLDELSAHGPVLGVHGNMDDAPLRARLPPAREIDLGDGRTLAVIHDAGPRQNRIERMRRRFPDAVAVVFGHSHIPLHERADDGFQIFNPGSPTERRRAPRHTMGLARVDQSPAALPAARPPAEIAFELIELD